MIASMPTQETRGDALHRLAASADRIATEHGFSLVSWENFPAKLMAVVSELVELSEAREVKDVTAELADCAIRMLGTLHRLDVGWCARLNAAIPGAPTPAPTFATLHDAVAPERRLWGVLRWLNKAFGHWRCGETTDAIMSVEYALAGVCGLADALGVDIVQAIAAKCALNEQRPRLHGKVEAL